MQNGEKQGRSTVSIKKRRKVVTEVDMYESDLSNLTGERELRGPKNTDNNVSCLLSQGEDNGLEECVFTI